MLHGNTVPKRLIEVSGSHGKMKFDRDTGYVYPEPITYDDHIIIRFDLREWFEYWQGPDTCDMPDHLDILDLGYWYDDGFLKIVYSEPEKYWREDRRDREDFGDDTIVAPSLIKVAREVLAGWASFDPAVDGENAIEEAITRLEKVVLRTERRAKLGLPT